jgi:uncharacterized protein YdaU (DUF1376 family)
VYTSEEKKWQKKRIERQVCAQHRRTSRNSGGSGEEDSGKQEPHEVQNFSDHGRNVTD